MIYKLFESQKIWMDYINREGFVALSFWKCVRLILFMCGRIGQGSFISWQDTNIGEGMVNIKNGNGGSSYNKSKLPLLGVSFLL